MTKNDYSVRMTNATSKKPKRGEATRAVKAVKAAPNKAAAEPPLPLPATWRALRTAFPRKTRVAVARAFANGGVTAEDVLALELAVVRGLLEDVNRNARYLAPHLRHVAALTREIRDRETAAQKAARRVADCERALAKW